MLEEIVSTVALGLITGSVYGLMALGISIVFGTVKVINMAHGTFVMLGMYIAYWLQALYGLNPILSFMIVLPPFFAAGVAIQRFFLDRLIKLKLRPGEVAVMMVLLTFGFAIVIQNSVLFAWTPDTRSLNIPFFTKTVNIGALNLSYARFITMFISILMYMLLSLFFKMTYLGKAIRAFIENREAAALVGVNAESMASIGVGLGLSITAASVTLLSLLWSIYPTVGWLFQFYAFAIVTLGGMGSIPGSLLGGLIFGVVEGMCARFYQTLAVPLMVALIFTVMLLVKPSGLLGAGRR